MVDLQMDRLADLGRPCLLDPDDDLILVGDAWRGDAAGWGGASFDELCVCVGLRTELLDDSDSRFDPVALGCEPEGFGSDPERDRTDRHRLGEFSGQW